MKYKFPMSISGIPDVRVVKINVWFQVQGRDDANSPWVDAGELHDTVDDALDFSEEYYEY